MIIGNIHRDEVEVNIPRKSLSLRRIIVLVFLHIQVNIRNNCPSLYSKVTFLHEIIYVVVNENETYTLKKFYSKFCWVFRVF